jgi:hypothetical protein
MNEFTRIKFRNEGFKAVRKIVLSHEDFGRLVIPESGVKMPCTIQDLGVSQWL